MTGLNLNLLAMLKEVANIFAVTYSNLPLSPPEIIISGESDARIVAENLSKRLLWECCGVNIETSTPSRAILNFQGNNISVVVVRVPKEDIFQL